MAQHLVNDLLRWKRDYPTARTDATESQGPNKRMKGLKVEEVTALFAFPSLTCVSVHEISWSEGGKDKADAPEKHNRVFSVCKTTGLQIPKSTIFHNICAVWSKNQILHGNYISLSPLFFPLAYFLFHYNKGKSTYNYHSVRTLSFPKLLSSRWDLLPVSRVDTDLPGEKKQRCKYTQEMEIDFSLSRPCLL